MTRNAPRIGFVSLGCPKATVASEQVITQLRAEGYQIGLDGPTLVAVRHRSFIHQLAKHAVHHQVWVAPDLEDSPTHLPPAIRSSN